MSDTLKKLSNLIASRKNQSNENSYTKYLFEQGIDKICKKIGEEATETVIAAKNNNKSELISEASDLIYHLLVLLENQNIKFEEVLYELDKRTQKMGNLKKSNEKGEL